MIESKKPIAYRFRGYLPVVIDFETGGFNAETDALLEAAAVIIEMTMEYWYRESVTSSTLTHLKAPTSTKHP